MDLFENTGTAELKKTAPLAFKMRPADFPEFIGQKHIAGENTPLRKALDNDRLMSLIFYGPPGTGKTALANLIAQKTNSFFAPLNAVTAKVDDLRRVIKKAKENMGMYSRRTIMFIDEIHRFTKVQQDALLPDVESGTVVLIGVTTENPYFSVIPALISRVMVLEFKPLSLDNIKQIITKAVDDKERGLGALKVKIDDDTMDFLIRLAHGDARIALNVLESAVYISPRKNKDEICLDVKTIEEVVQKKSVLYDRKGDSHYDTISAFIKSMRGSDPDATVYWLAKMIYAGEDPRFIARRIVICASEDVGNADPLALILAQSAFTACEKIGMPEARIILSQAAVYVASAPKSNASYLAIDKALEDIKNGVDLEVPIYLREASYKGAKDLGRGKGYIYPHNSPDHFAIQDYLPEKRKYYEPTEEGREKMIKERLKKLWGNIKTVMGDG